MNQSRQSVPERFQWALEILAISPTDHLLEIGCGTGILAGQVAHQLTTGTLTAVDQSNAMIAKARKQNQPFVKSEKIRFWAEHFAEVQFDGFSYDKIFAFNVSLFWGKQAQELQLIKNYLKPDGKLYVFHQPPHEITRSVAKRTVEKLEENGFVIEQVLFKELPVASASCIISRPS